MEKDILDQLSGDISASVSLDGQVRRAGRAEGPGGLRATRSRRSPSALPTLAEGLGLDDVTLVRPKGGKDFYALATPDGDSIVFGVKNGVFVITNDPGRADSLALDEPTRCAGQQGAVVVQADAEQIALKILEQLGDPIPIPEQLRPALVAPLGLPHRLAEGGHERRDAARSGSRSTSSRRGKKRPRPRAGRAGGDEARRLGPQLEGLTRPMKAVPSAIGGWAGSFSRGCCPRRRRARA